MATRPVFTVKEAFPYYATVNTEFEWNGGLAVVQKQKNITAIHNAFMRMMPEKRVLEISSKSMQDGGEALSAFLLPKYVPELGRSVPVECVYHAGKVFRNGGPYKELLTTTPHDAKTEPRLKTSGALVRYTFDGRDFPIVPNTVFYDYIYINALFENPELTAPLLQYDAFTDIEFNPQKSLNCQARACAIFVSLTRLGLIERARDFDSFLELCSKGTPAAPVKTEAAAPALTDTAKKEPAADFACGDTVVHGKFGKGKIVNVKETSLEIEFPGYGIKSLGKPWCLANCKIEKRE